MLFPPEQAALKPVLARWAVAFARALKTHLREDGDVGAGAVAALTCGAQKALRVRGNATPPLPCPQPHSPHAPPPLPPPPPSELASVLEPHEVAVVAASNNRPLACLQAMSNAVLAARLDPVTMTRCAGPPALGLGQQEVRRPGLHPALQRPALPGAGSCRLLRCTTA
jgi:hypothetical protein